MALQTVLRQYTNAAASIVSELLSFTTKFAIQVGGHGVAAQVQPHCCPSWPAPPAARAAWCRNAAP